MKQIEEAYIVAARRTPIGRAPKGMFKSVRPDDLLVSAINAVTSDVPSLPVEAIEDAIIGCSVPEAQQGLNIARFAVVLAGLPKSVAGVTVNRFCASGITSIAMAADRIRVGEADVVLAGGVESMSQVPMMGNRPSMNQSIFDNQDIGIAYGMGMTAENVARRWNISRAQQDEFALASHQRAIGAIDAGSFSDEIVPMKISARSVDLESRSLQEKEHLIDTDEGPRRDTSMESLAKLRTVFAAEGSVTAGNSSQTSDGAGALILASESALKKYDLTPLAKFRSFAARGVEPEIMGIGPIEAIPKALQFAGLKQDDLDWIELNEAFAAQSLAVINELHLDPECINPLGGAIALGHPLGATGAVRAATVIHGLRRTEKNYGMVTMCVGMGMGAAGIFERV